MSTSTRESTERKLGMSQSNWIQLGLFIAALIAGIVASFQCYQYSQGDEIERERERAAQLQHITDVIEQEAIDIKEIKEDVKRINGSVSDLKTSDGVQNEKITNLEREVYFK